MLKPTSLSGVIKRMSLTMHIALISTAVLIGLSCGKRSAPLPPRERVNQRVEIAGFQRGSNVILSWKMPARNAAQGSVLNIDRVDVYRLAEPQSAPLSLSEEEFASRSILVASIPVASTDFALNSMAYTDALEFASQRARLRYAVRFVNSSGQKAGFSNFFLIEPASGIASAPTSLAAAVSQDSIELEWTGPSVNVDGSTPPNIIGYYVYRSTSEKEAAKLLTPSPIQASRFRDEFFRFGTEYFYFVRAVSAGTGGRPVESGESNITRLTPKDVFPPGAPAGITLAASPTIISIFFATNPENDVAGYRIYRSEDPAVDKGTWTLLTREMLTTNTFQDIKVEAGKTYYYYLTATDTAGNTSQPSEVVSEKIQ